MAHAVGGNLRRHTGSHGAHPDGWWRFALAALVAAGLGIAIANSPLFVGSDPADAPLPAAPVAVAPASPSSDAIPIPGPNVIRPPVAAMEPPLAVVGPAPQVETQPVVTAPPPAIAAVGRGIRSVDFAGLPLLQALSGRLAGRVDKAAITFADLTGDGSEDAIVPITSDGTFGNLAVVVFTEKDGAPQAVLTRLAGRERRGLILVFERGVLTETSGLYGPFDANCCPSQLVKTYFRWDGSNLVVDHTDTLTAAPGKQAN